MVRAGANQQLKLYYLGAPSVRPAIKVIDLEVPARTAFRVSDRRLLNGQSVTFGGRVAVPPTGMAARGKLVELQTKLSGRWQTFRTVRTDAQGRWRVRLQVPAHTRADPLQVPGPLAARRGHTPSPLARPGPFALRCGAANAQACDLRERHRRSWRCSSPWGALRMRCPRSARRRSRTTRFARSMSGTGQLTSRDVKRGSLGARAVKESALGTVPRANRVGGKTGAQLTLRCPPGMAAQHGQLHRAHAKARACLRLRARHMRGWRGASCRATKNSSPSPTMRPVGWQEQGRWRRTCTPQPGTRRSAASPGRDQTSPVDIDTVPNTFAGGRQFRCAANAING